MYLYSINYTSEQQEFCALEMKRLFNQPLSSLIISDKNYDAGRSAYFKAKMDVLVFEKEWDLFIEKLSTIHVEKFKISYFKHKTDELSYDKRMELVKMCANVVNGIGCLEEDALNLAVVYYEDCYYFGIVDKDHQSWQLHQNKPQSYSQSLSARDARTLVNIATAGKDISLIDPCCGVATIVLEALAMGHRIDACELNVGVAWKANRNLEYFGYEKIVQNKDMHTIEKHYDVAILDIPYNLYSSITSDEQIALIKTCGRIADELVLISYEQLDEMVENAGFKIIEKCGLHKIKMQRYIYLCEVRG